MIKPESWSSREGALLLVNAYLDGELDAASVMEVERRLDTDAALKAEYDRLLRLRSTIARHIPKSRASDALRDRIARMAVAPSTSPRVRAVTPAYSFDWRQMAAAVVIGACLAGSSTYLLLRPDAPSGDVAAIVAVHQHALLATTPVEVASSDRHTVKPWFDSKLALSPRVVDLAASGFPLLGGRIDSIDGHPVPALLYQRHRHLISVIAVPTPGGHDDGARILRATRDGFAVIGWRDRDFVYYAVSDIAQEDFDAFLAAWHKEAAP